MKEFKHWGIGNPDLHNTRPNSAIFNNTFGLYINELFTKKWKKKTTKMKKTTNFVVILSIEEISSCT